MDMERLLQHRIGRMAIPSAEIGVKISGDMLTPFILPALVLYARGLELSILSSLQVLQLVYAA